VLADARPGVRPPGRREQLDDRAPVEPVDRVVVAAPALLHRLLPGLLDALVAELVLDKRDQAQDRLGHQVVQHQPLVLHCLAQLARHIEVARVDRLDGAVHRRS
jgi:hypothetical protein